MAKFIPFQNLVAVLKDKLGIDATAEIEKAWQTDIDALREGIATKSDDSRVAVLVTDVAEIKSTLAELKTLLTGVTPALAESVKSIQVPTAVMPENYEKFVTDTTVSLTALQTGLKEALDRIAQIPTQQKSEPVFAGINTGQATKDLMAAITNVNQKAAAATQTLFSTSTLNFDK